MGFDQAPKKYRVLSKILIASQISVSILAVLLSQQTTNTAIQAASIYALLLSIMGLSNATQNQRDILHRFFHSYSTKIHHSIAFTSIASVACDSEDVMQQMLVSATAILFAIDAAIGIQIFMKVFKIMNKQMDNQNITESYLPRDERKAIARENRVEVKPNDRLPLALRENELLTKLFNQGWKFNMFNVDGQIFKQVAALSVIFAQLYFSSITLIMNHHNSVNAVAVFSLIYSSVSLYSFFNFSYVRDFDVIQVNFTPLALAATCIFYCVFARDAGLVLDGLSIALMADAYFALRFRDDSDEIDFTLLEQFSLQSWTEDSFNKDGFLTLQIAAISLIFSQVFFALVGVIDGASLQVMMLAFYLARFAQFLGNTVSGVRILQSNMTCLLLSCLLLTNLRGAGYMAAAQAILTIADAYVGALIFSLDKKKQAQNLLESFLSSLEGFKFVKKQIKIFDLKDSDEVEQLDEQFQKI
uniref:Uncharacterized protein n=1 Tax=Strombidium rassoulzadegani TaxID=1082188 RepID=A0A7S3CUG0_9SPIT|mmetsp:Transcript_974/g.1742  ORF Transcript_974/g.1742 Transcript_974/m.1742 type:complete len:472 (+) Transcript_974:118-1533(+)